MVWVYLYGLLGPMEHPYKFSTMWFSLYYTDYINSRIIKLSVCKYEQTNAKSLNQNVNRVKNGKVVTMYGTNSPWFHDIPGLRDIFVI